MLSESERLYLLGKLKPPVNYRWQLDHRIKEKAISALKDLGFIAEYHNEKQLKKIFKTQTIQPFIERLLLRHLEPPRKFKVKGLQRQRILDRQYRLAETLLNIASKRIKKAEWSGTGFGYSSGNIFLKEKK